MRRHHYRAAVARFCCVNVVFAITSRHAPGNGEDLAIGTNVFSSQLGDLAPAHAAPRRKQDKGFESLRFDGIGQLRDLIHGQNDRLTLTRRIHHANDLARVAVQVTIGDRRRQDRMQQRVNLAVAPGVLCSQRRRTTRAPPRE